MLAAGASRRLGFPKQLVRQNEKSLLEHTFELTSNLNLNARLVVLGANADEIKASLQFGEFETLENRNWNSGMAGSIKVGLQQIIDKHPDTSATLILVCDQPLLTTEVLENMIDNYISGSPIVACKYDEVIGVPVLFDQSYFPELLELQGDQGARQILNKYEQDASFVDFPDGSFDIDTQEDLEKLRQTP